MFLKANRILQVIVAAAMATTVAAGAQAPATPAAAPDQTPTTAPAAPAQAPAAAPAAAPTWSVGPLDLSGFIDGYYSYNFNQPSNAANGQINDLYNFNDKTDQFSLSAAKLTLNHDPDPVGVHVDFFYGRTNTLVNAPGPNSGGEGNYIEQAFLSVKPPKAKGFELDFGKFVTSAGAEVIEAKDNWNYSRSLLFAYAIPYFHFGARTSMPVSKTETVGIQVVNGWNNVTKTNGGVTVGFTSVYTQPKYVWNVNYYVGPENANTTSGLRNLFDSTLTLTPNAKLTAYLNYDYAENRDAIAAQGDTNLNHWQGFAMAARGQVTGPAAVVTRCEYFTDRQGFETGTAQDLKECTGMFEYKWAQGLLMRAEYRHDWSNKYVFHTDSTKLVQAQSTATLAFIAFFGPKR